VSSARCFGELEPAKCAAQLSLPSGGPTPDIAQPSAASAPSVMPRASAISCHTERFSQTTSKNSERRGDERYGLGLRDMARRPSRVGFATRKTASSPVSTSVTTARACSAVLALLCARDSASALRSAGLPPTVTADRAQLLAHLFELERLAARLAEVANGLYDELSR
jgi:hypothetical protein